MTTGRVTVLTAGHVTHDRYDGGRFRAGGSAFFGARAARSLGARSRLVTSVGVDFERYEELSGLELLLKVQGSTTGFENSYPGGRTRVQRISSVGSPVTPASLPAEWRRAHALFLAPVIGEIDTLAWLDAVEAPIVGLGLQGLLRQPGPIDGERTRSVVARPFLLGDEILRRVDVAFLSDEDLAELGSPTLLSDLKRVVPTVVTTLGAAGSRVWCRGSECNVGTFPVSVADPTGAGDVFAAAFLVASSEGAAPEEAARLASGAASIIVEAEAGSALERLGESRERARHIAVS
jgi:1D-myo-inositol 3-kinase